MSEDCEIRRWAKRLGRSCGSECCQVLGSLPLKVRQAQARPANLAVSRAPLDHSQVLCLMSTMVQSRQKVGFDILPLKRLTHFC